MKLVRNSLVPWGPYKLVTLGPWIFVRHSTTVTDVDINHEAIHWEQQKELLVILFLVLYCLMMLWELVRCMLDSHRGASPYGYRRSLWKRAYRSIAFEREAYLNEKNLAYIDKRRHYAWMKT